MDKFIIVLQVFLAVSGGWAIISSLIAASNQKAESHSDLTTKWFSFKGPIRLIYGLLAIIFVILAVVSNFFGLVGKNTHLLAQENKRLNAETIYLQEKMNGTNIKLKTAFIHLGKDEAKSIYDGKIVLSFVTNYITIRGCMLFDENRNWITSSTFSPITGDKYYLIYHTGWYTLNVLHGKFEDDYVELEVMKD